MPVDETDFFKQATLRICSSLDIGEVAQECLDFLKSYIPLDGVMMSYYDPKTETFTIMTIRTAIPLNTHIKSIPMPPDGPRLFEKVKNTVRIFNITEEYSIPFTIWKTLGLVEKSSLVLFTWFRGRRLGQIDFFVRGRNRYTDEHARLIELLEKPFSIAMANNLQYQDIVNIKDLFSDDIRQLRHELKQASGTEIIGANGGLQNVMKVVDQVAPLTTPVLLLGETGVGKEIIANRIHYSSPRREGPFVKINCGAIPEGLIDNELFGHEKGAFTGALSQVPGRFERAHQGTIFLDEVGDLPLSVQVRLLRVLQDKEIERVGGTRPIRVDVRIIAATNRNLEDLVREGSFREDLWFRLNVFPVNIPPLRERKQDIPVLVHHFIMSKSRELNLRVNPELAPGTMESLLAYDWPGNVRELQNKVERALIRTRIVDPAQPLSFEEFAPPEDSAAGRFQPEQGATILTLDQAMKQHIQTALEIAHGRIKGRGGAAELLEINPNTLRHRMRSLGIPYGRRAGRKHGA
ncbi:MAG TPA: sigma 54-interacting transcriptional regulator [Deltaproteobacteria bacterium]|jgi:transcriptional regulator with GAF, ATPase, and Fis domain|nr:sigma 54-interacting transcriptional regulator [Deltaproteobacteria bacterium]HOI08454.1 sigma 54-interacting transcriptional regulator [Deltaproteobacteria bacterium]